MIIEELQIFNILDCKQLKLRFNNLRSSVYVVLNNDDPKSPHLLTLAVHLLCSAKYADFSLCDEPIFEKVCDGFIRMEFILPIVPNCHSDEAISVPIDVELDLGRSTGLPVLALTHPSDCDPQVASVDMEPDLGPSTSQAAQKRLYEQQQQARTQSDQPEQQPRNLVQKFIVVKVMRDFRNGPNEVSYTVNNGTNQQWCSVAAFHGRFGICLDYMLPFLKNLSLDFNGDWIELLSSDLNEKWNQRAEFDDPFKKFVNLYHKYGFPEQHILKEITRARLSNSDAIDVLQKTYVIKMLRDTRGIFEFITAKEYTVSFYTPHYGRYADVVLDVKVDDLNFDYMTTYIQDKLKPNGQKIIWSEAQPAIKDMLLIAFQISLSFHCKQQIIYLNKLEEISNYQAIQLATTACFQKLGFDKPVWKCKNYLQRIVDVCISSGTTAIIEYPGGTPLHPVNAYLMKSFKTIEADKTWFSLKIINDEQYSFECFLERLQQGLKNV